MKHAIYIIPILICLIAVNLTSLSTSPNLGKTLEDKINEEILKTKRKQLESQYLYWQQTILSKPNYRDAYLTLSLIASRLTRDFDAQKYLRNGIDLDPNNPIGLEVEKQILGK